MNSLSLSNLGLSPNLLAWEREEGGRRVGYQHDFPRLTVFEVIDLNRRNPGLYPSPQRTPEQRRQWTQSLGWGIDPPRTGDGGRDRWQEAYLPHLEAAVRELETGHPTAEAAYELLVLTRPMCHPPFTPEVRAAARAWDQRVCAVLARDEFRQTDDLIDRRLSLILGRPAARD